MNKNTNSIKASLLDDIQQGWSDLNAFLDSLTNEQMTTILDSEGWGVKDHIAHLAAWERSVIFFLQKKPRYEGLGVDKALYDNGTIDEVNAVIHNQDQSKSIQEVLAQFRDIHAELMSLIEALSDHDLKQPLQNFHPEIGEGDPRLVLKIISDNTSNHFAEHLTWIREMIHKEE